MSSSAASRLWGTALPGGFVEVGESVEDAARREMKEELNIELHDLKQFRVYSDPGRDPRRHVVSVVFVARAGGEAVAGDDAGAVHTENLWLLPDNLCFDHRQILEDYRKNVAP